MNKKQIHQDVYVGFVGLLFCALAWVVCSGLPSNAGMMPRLLIGLLVVLSVVITIQGFQKSKLPADDQGKKAFTVDAVKIPVAAWLLVAGYVILFKFAGYFVATAVMLVVFMRFMKVKNWKAIILITVLYLVAIYVAFVRLLGVPIADFGLLGNMLF